MMKTSQAHGLTPVGFLFGWFASSAGARLYGEGL